MTALSPVVRWLIQETGVTDQVDAGCLQDGCLLNWQHIQRMLSAPSDEAGYYKLNVGIMAPVFNVAGKFMLSLTLAEFQKKFNLYLQWTGSAATQMLEDCFLLLSKADKCLTLTGLLLVTSVLEHSLGDVYLMKSSPCPSMLKDLLVTQELRETFGDIVIQVLRLVIGPPVSLNLRNVAWHGFPAPGEIPDRYAWFLLLLVPSLGQILHDKGVDLMTIPHRQHVCFPSLFQEQDLTDEIDLEAVQNIYEKSELVSQQSLPLWMTSLNFYRHKKYGHCTALLVTQLEHGLRRMFCAVNDCPRRILTAEATTLYTTFDEIFNKYVEPGVENKYVTQIGENLMSMLLDLLVYPEGPRIRDKLSHGEVDWFHFPKSLALDVIMISTGLALKDLFLHADDREMQAVKIISDKTETYESRFHPISIIKRKILGVVSLTSGLDSVIVYTPTLELRQTACAVVTCCQTEKFVEIYDAIGHILEILRVSWDQSHYVTLQDVSSGFMSVMCDGYSLVMKILSKPIRTLFRCQKVQVSENSSDSHSNYENEVICLLHQVISQCQEVMSQVTNTLVTRQQQFHNKILRSRKRENLKKLIESCSTLYLAIHIVVLLVIWCLYGLESGQEAQDQHTQRVHIKFLKTMLQFCENLRTYTSVCKNKWIEAMDLELNFLQKTQNYLSQHLLSKTQVALNC